MKQYKLLATATALLLALTACSSDDSSTSTTPPVTNNNATIPVIDSNINSFETKEAETPDDSDSEDTTSEDTASEDTTSEDTASEDTASEDTASEDSTEESDGTTTAESPELPDDAATQDEEPPAVPEEPLNLNLEEYQTYSSVLSSHETDLNEHIQQVNTAYDSFRQDPSDSTNFNTVLDAIQEALTFSRSMEILSVPQDIAGEHHAVVVSSCDIFNHILNTVGTISTYLEENGSLDAFPESATKNLVTLEEISVNNLNALEEGMSVLKETMTKYMELAN